MTNYTETNLTAAQCESYSELVDRIQQQTGKSRTAIYYMLLEDGITSDTM
jgi:hypothetical protein